MRRGGREAAVFVGRRWEWRMKRISGRRETSGWRAVNNKKNGRPLLGGATAQILPFRSTRGSPPVDAARMHIWLKAKGKMAASTFA